jgi:hypothetical protein
MKRPLESDYTSQAAYTRALEMYCENDDTQVYAADTAIVNTLLPKLYSIIDRLLDGQDKALVIEARRVLPKTYKNSFEKGKNA